MRTMTSPIRRRFFGDEPTPGTQAAPLETQAIPPQPEVFEEIQAPYHFTEEETNAMNHALRAALDNADTLKEQAKAAAMDFKLRIQNSQNESKMLRNKLTAGEETRPMRALVEFEPKRSKKKFLNPETREFIREESMQPADWQLPLFKPTEEPKPAVAPSGETQQPEREAKAPASSPVGETSVANALDKAAAETQPPQILLDLTKEDYTASGLMRSFRAAAKKSEWNPAQISTLSDRLKEATSVQAMIDTLRPFTIAAAADHAQPPITEPAGDFDDLPKVPVELQPGFTADRVRAAFCKAANNAGWDNDSITKINAQAIDAASVEDEPEASERVIAIFAPYITSPAEEPDHDDQSAAQTAGEADPTDL